MFYVTLTKYNSVTPAAPTALTGGQLCWVASSQISEHLETCAVLGKQEFQADICCKDVLSVQWFQNSPKWLLHVDVAGM